MARARQYNTNLIDAIMALPMDASDEMVKLKLDEAYGKFKHVNEKARNAAGDTPLMVAVKRGHLKAVTWLLQPPFFSWRWRADISYEFIYPNQSAAHYAVNYPDLMTIPTNQLPPHEKDLLMQKRRIILRLQRYNRNAINDFAVLLTAVEAGNIWFFIKIIRIYSA